ncbi:MAG: TonB family protein [Planctomycetota bacterium]|nr:TonB family protein [Planctomycetota bacterium]
MKHAGALLCLLLLLPAGCASTSDGGGAYVQADAPAARPAEDRAERRSERRDERRARGGGPVFTTADLDRTPRVLNQPPPELTDQMRAEAPGTVRVVFIVNRRGRVENAYVQDSTDPIFEAPALAAVQRWRFEPGTREGKPVRVRMRVPISFTGAVSEPEDALPPVEPELGELPSDVGPRHRLSEVELELWNDPAFQRWFAESYIAETEIEPRITSEEREQMERVLEAISADRMDRAATLLERNRGEAASAVFDFTLANIHFQRDELEEAVEIYEVAVDKYPKFRRAWQNLGVIHVRRGDFEPALPALTRVIELGGGDAITYGLLGYSYLNVENDLAAESAYRMAVLLDPDTPDWQTGLARSFFKQRRFADAAALCGRLIAEDPDRADLWLLQANAFIGLEEPLRAAENYELVDRLGESTVDSLNMLGDIYVNEQLFELAVGAYIRALELDPEAPVERAVRAAKVLTARGALQQTRHLVQAIEARRGDELSTEDRKDLLKLRARIAVAEGAGEEEARVLEQIVELDPLDGEALILLGQHATRAGDEEKAIFYYERAAAIEASEADAKVRHAQLLVKQGKYEQALPLLRSAQQIKPRENVRQYLEQVEQFAKAR